MKIPFFELAAAELLQQMPKKTLEKLTKAPAALQAEIIGNIYELAKDFFKKEFIKYTMEGIERFNKEGDLND